MRNTGVITVKASARFLTIALLGLSSAGCAISEHGHPVRGEKPQPRHELLSTMQGVVRDSDQRRDTMQMELAESCWRSGDGAGCRRNLEEIVVRNPNHREAQLRLAEICLLDDQPEDALGTIRTFCQQNPTDAAACHLLGLVNEAMGDDVQARACFGRAVEIEPGNAIFRTSWETALPSQDIVSNQQPPRKPTVLHPRRNETSRAAKPATARQAGHRHDSNNS